MKTFQKLSAPLVLTLALSACGSTGYQTQDDIVQRSEVSMVRMAHVVAPEADASADLSTLTIANLSSFLQMHGAGYGDTILIDQGTGVEAARVEELVTWIKKQGLTLGETDGVFGGIPMDGGMTVYIERYVISKSPNCSNWSSDSRVNRNNAPTSMFGCATTNALDAAVANKRDLIDGQDGGNTNSGATKPATQHQTTGSGPRRTNTGRSGNNTGTGTGTGLGSGVQ